MHWSREQYRAYMTGEDISRPFFTELFGPLVGLDAQWREQGATPDEIDLSAFCWDHVTRVHCGGVTKGVFEREQETLVDTPERLVFRDPMGRVVELDKRTATIPLPQSFPVASMDDWQAIKPAYQWRDDRIDEAQIAKAAAAREDGAIVFANIPGAYDTCRQLMGDELACMAFITEPELSHDIVDTLHATARRVLDAVSQRVTIDWLSVHEDFAGRGGPLVGPNVLAEYHQPYYRDVWDMLHERGAWGFDIDSDGDVAPILDALIDCGINTLHPMEPVGNTDPVAFRERYGLSLRMRGGIDKFVIRNGAPADIRRELEYKMQPSMRGGGMVFAMDHRIPDGTPIENYRYYVDTGREILGLPPRAELAEAERVFVRSA